MRQRFSLSRPLGFVIALTATMLSCASSEEGGGKDAPPSPALGQKRHIAEPARADVGSDHSLLPDRFPEAAWARLEGTMLQLSVRTQVVVDGVSGIGILDTGAEATSMSEPMAAAMGVLDNGEDTGETIRMFDAHNEVTLARVYRLRELSVAGRVWKNPRIIVGGDLPNIFLVGFDLLKDVDLYIAADEGLVGLFPPDASPVYPDDVVVRLANPGNKLTVHASASGSKGTVDFEFLVDTGASLTSVPAAIGIQGGLPAALNYEAKMTGANSVSEFRGMFVLDPLYLGDQELNAGQVRALAAIIDSGRTFGLLGNDVFMRFRTLIRARDSEMRVRELPRRPPLRTKGPHDVKCTDGEGAAVPCVQVGLVKTPSNMLAPKGARQDITLRIDIEDVWKGNTLELTVLARAKNGRRIFSGGALRYFVTVGNGGNHSFYVLQSGTKEMGLDLDSELSLQWVRNNGFTWPCDPLAVNCTSVSGPLPK